MEQYDLSRFVSAHQQGYLWGSDYQQALLEMQQGQKISHWMWYIFPQIRGLGSSDTTKLFSIEDLDEAKAFLDHPYLGNNLITITKVLLENPSSDPIRVMGIPDNKKLRSCMTLFSHAAPQETVFRAVLQKYFNGQEDRRTLQILNAIPRTPK